METLGSNVSTSTSTSTSETAPPNRRRRLLIIVLPIVVLALAAVFAVRAGLSGAFFNSTQGGTAAGQAAVIHVQINGDPQPFSLSADNLLPGADPALQTMTVQSESTVVGDLVITGLSQAHCTEGPNGKPSDTDAGQMFKIGVQGVTGGDFKPVSQYMGQQQAGSDLLRLGTLQPNMSQQVRFEIGYDSSADNTFQGVSCSVDLNVILQQAS